MSLRPVLPLLLLIVASACGSDSPATPTCPARCPTGQVCGSAGTCVAANSSGGSTVPLSCPQTDKPLGTSSFLPQVPGAPSVILDEPHTVGEKVTFTVPPNTASLTIVEQATKAPDVVSFNFPGSGRLDTDNVAVPHTVTSPGGLPFFNDLDDGGSLPPPNSSPDYFTTHSAFFFSDSPATGTLTFPNTSDALAIVNGTGLPSGSWSMVVSDLAYECQANVFVGAECLAGALDSTYQVTIIAKPLDAGGHIPASGKLDVVVYSATASLNAVDTDPDLQRMAATLNAIYAQQNALISIGSVTFKNLRLRGAPAAPQAGREGQHLQHLHGLGPRREHDHEHEPHHRRHRWHHPWAREHRRDRRERGGGLGGEPPPELGDDRLRGQRELPGLRRRPDRLHHRPRETAYIIAHEAGHFLGLYHVTEQYGAEFDPLLDTPTCVCASCSTAPSTCADPAQGAPPASADRVRVNECLGAKPGCGGGDNLMFWLLSTGSQGMLTAEQGQVIRANPLIH